MANVEPSSPEIVLASSVREIVTPQERGAEAYSCTPHKPNDEDVARLRTIGARTRS